MRSRTEFRRSLTVLADNAGASHVFGADTLSSRSSGAGEQPADAATLKRRLENELLALEAVCCAPPPPTVKHGGRRTCRPSSSRRTWRRW